jgi:hypothetical protein
MKAAIDEQRHLKPQSHWDRELQRWNYCEEHDAAMLAQLHDQQRLGRSSGKSVVSSGQRRLLQVLFEDRGGIGGGFSKPETKTKEEEETASSATASSTQEETKASAAQ